MTRSSGRFCHLAFLLTALWSLTAAAQEWPRFRGPNGAGQSDATTVPLSWRLEECLWRVELPGVGYSSPVVHGERVFVTSANEADGTRTIRCHSATTGELAWEKTYPSATYKKHKDCALASATPALDQERLYTTWVTPQEYLVLALDQATGEEKWRRDLGPFKFMHGYGGSPIVFEGLVIVPDDQEKGGASSLVALAAATGALRWQVDRRTDRAAYSTPCLYQPAGSPAQLIVASSAEGISSLDPATGKVNWQVALTDSERVVFSPVVAGDLILAGCGSGGAGKRLIAVRPGDLAKETPGEEAYEVKGGLPYVPTPIAHQGLLVLWGDSGVVSCLDAATGEDHWRERVEGTFYGSPVRVGERLYCVSRQGKMVVLAAAKEFKQLAEFDLGEPSFATPAVANGVMFLRTHSHLMAVGKRGP